MKLLLVLLLLLSVGCSARVLPPIEPTDRMAWAEKLDYRVKRGERLPSCIAAREVAAHGSAEATGILGWCYLKGIDRPADKTAAMENFEECARAGIEHCRATLKKMKRKVPAVDAEAAQAHRIYMSLLHQDQRIYQQAVANRNERQLRAQIKDQRAANFWQGFAGAAALGLQGFAAMQQAENQYYRSYGPRSFNCSSTEIIPGSISTRCTEW